MKKKANFIHASMYASSYRFKKKIIIFHASSHHVIHDTYRIIEMLGIYVLFVDTSRAKFRFFFYTSRPFARQWSLISFLSI